MRPFLIVLIIAVAVFAKPEAEYGEFDKLYGVLALNGCSHASVESVLQNPSHDIHNTKGLILDLRNCAAPDSNMIGVLGKFTDVPLETDWTRVEPVGERQYVKPVVLMIKDEWKDTMLMEMFTTERDYAELETSGNTDKAKKQLKKLVHKKESTERDKLERMFEAAPPLTPTK